MTKKFNKVFVLAEKTDLLRELCGVGTQLGKQVTAFSFGLTHEDEETLPSCADKIYRMTIPARSGMNPCFETILHLVREDRPDMVLVEAGKEGRLVAGRLAAVCRTSALVDIVGTIDGEQWQTRRIVYGGAAIRTEHSAPPVTIATMGRGVFQSQEPVSPRQGSLVDVEVIPPACPMARLEIRKKESVSVDLTVAKRIVGVGRGFAKKEDLDLARELAALIGAEIGCTRPIAEGENWLPLESYIGVSGAMLRPDLYFAIGISGQIQHMIGVNPSKTIIAVNKDKAAPIFRQADYGIVGDLYEVVPVLINRIRQG